MEVSVLSHTEEPGNVLSHLMQLLCFNTVLHADEDWKKRLETHLLHMEGAGFAVSAAVKDGVGQAESLGSKNTTCAEGSSQAFGRHKLELPGGSSCPHQHFAHIWSLSNLLGYLESS